MSPLGGCNEYGTNNIANAQSQVELFHRQKCSSLNVQTGVKVPRT